MSAEELDISRLRNEFKKKIGEAVVADTNREGKALKLYEEALAIYFNENFKKLRDPVQNQEIGVYVNRMSELKSALGDEASSGGGGGASASSSTPIQRSWLQRLMDRRKPSASRDIETGGEGDGVDESSAPAPITRELSDEGWLGVETPERPEPTARRPTDEFESLESVPGSPPRRIRPTEDAPHYAASLAVAARDQFGGSINHLYKNIYDTKTQNWYSVDSREGRSILKAYLQKLL